MAAVILVRKNGLSQGLRVGSITQNRKGFFWHGWAEGKARSARTASASVDEAFEKARKVLGDIAILVGDYS